MLTVTHNGQTEPLNQISNFEMTEEVNGALTVSFTSFSMPNNPGHALLDEESLVEIEGYEFRVKQLKESTNRKSVTAISTYFDTAGIIQEEIYGGTRTLSEFLTFALTNTGWAFEVQGSIPPALIPNFGEDNTVKLIQQICAAFECEFQIKPNNHLVFAKQIGGDNDFQYRYKHNIKTLSKSVDTSEMRMSITGYGANGLVVKYTSPNASKFPHIGAAEPVRDDRFTTAENLSEYVKGKLVDYPKTIIELDSVDVTNRDLGERVWLIYEPLNMEYQTRVMSKKGVLRKGKLVTASSTIGNVVPRDLSDILTQQKVEIDENAKQTRSRFEQTNEMIDMAVERFDGEILDAYAQIQITADGILEQVGAVKIELEDGIANSNTLINQTAFQIRQEVNTEIARIDGRVEDNASSFTQIASSIRGEVSSEITRVDGRVDAANSSMTQLAGQISAKADASTVTSLGSRVSSVEWDMSAVDGKISSKVSETDFNGQTIMSKVNQTSSAYKVQAKNIQLDGITEVANTLYIGGDWRDSTNKSLQFRGSSGGVSVSSPAVDQLQLSASFLNVYARTSFYQEVDFRDAPIVHWGSNAPVARFG